MNKGKPTHFDVAANTKELHSDLFYRYVGISPALVASFITFAGSPISAFLESEIALAENLGI